MNKRMKTNYPEIHIDFGLFLNLKDYGLKLHCKK